MFTGKLKNAFRGWRIPHYVGHLTNFHDSARIYRHRRGARDVVAHQRTGSIEELDRSDRAAVRAGYAADWREQNIDRSSSWLYRV